MRPERDHRWGTIRSPEGALQREPSGLARLWRIVQELNPSMNVVNCGHAIDSVIHRLNGANPTSLAPNIGLGGNFDQIAARHGTRFTWRHSLEEIFAAIQSGGHGTIGLIAIVWTTTGSHIVAIGNVDGTTGICEGQDWNASSPPEVISDTRKAKLRYHPTGNENLGLAMVRWGCHSRGGWEGAHTLPRAVQPRPQRLGRCL